MPTKPSLKQPVKPPVKAAGATSSRTEVRSPTSTKTQASTKGNITVTGGAGRGATTRVIVHQHPHEMSGAGAQKSAIAQMIASEVKRTIGSIRRETKKR